MATLNYQTPVVYFFYPITIGAGQTIEIGIEYFTGQQMLSFLSVMTDTALGTSITIGDTTVITQGVNEDVPPDDTIYFVTLTNSDPANAVEIALTSWTIFT
jgi:hypothetical protein